MKLEKIPTKPPPKSDKKEARKRLARLQDELFQLQNVMFAESRHSLLIVLQGMDASGKDGTIRNVFSCINPMGCNVKAFKAPTEVEKAHDYMWRIYPHLPAKGMIQIFNRSYYEDILVPTVRETLPEEVIENRYDHINSFEHRLEMNGTKVMKFFLHLSQEEQQRRILDRLKKPHKRWKYSDEDFRASSRFGVYTEVYEKIFQKCGPANTWNIVPADIKWYRNLVIAEEVVKYLQSLDMKYPTPEHLQL